ncbi:MAG: hypothetical protein RBJ76_03240 [Stenomitos frigidus ULC029]
MHLDDIANLERLTQKPPPTKKPSSVPVSKTNTTAASKPPKTFNDLDLPNFSPPVVYATTDESDTLPPVPDEAVIDGNESDGSEGDLVVSTDDRYWQAPPLLSLAQDLLGIGAVWTAIGWSCSLPFIGHAFYFLLMAPITVGCLAIVYFLYLLYFRGLTRSRLEIAFQVLAMHSIIHDCCKLWFSGFPR